MFQYIRFGYFRLRGKLNLDIIIHKTSYNNMGIYYFYNVLQINLEANKPSSPLPPPKKKKTLGNDPFPLKASKIHYQGQFFCFVAG